MEKRGFPNARVLPLWIEVWLAMSAIICFLDVMFTMLRPHTTEGVLAGIYYGWNLYASVDVRYADTKDIVTCATGRVMLVEIAMNLIAVYLSRRRSRHALITAFTTTAFVFWKTVWFLTLYVMPPPGNKPYFTEDSSYLDILLIFWIPNGFWVLIPFIVMISLWDKLAVPVDVVEQYKAVSTA
ncbi:hypothetical protein ANCCAN_04544 [Ancylostoma caninum]|uniref:Emopamil binding protein n=1 Tax=Ancylostoma caninum TaxID=29170 RepID=A0A368GY78_ANCCA|nr:hypothetical protein ANCCAN_04544 [Ancylostoma caninum]